MAYSISFIPLYLGFVFSFSLESFVYYYFISTIGYIVLLFLCASFNPIIQHVFSFLIPVTPFLSDAHRLVRVMILG